MTRISKPRNSTSTIKFLYSYGGKLLPRPTDRRLRYVGGYTRVLAVPRSITFSELMVKLGEVCGSAMSFKCKLPSEDVDVLVSVGCDEDLANVIEEYDRVWSSTHQDVKIRALLFPLKSPKFPISHAPSTVPGVNYSASASALPRCSVTRPVDLEAEISGWRLALLLTRKDYLPLQNR